MLGRNVLDRQRPKAVYAIHTEVTGTGPYTDLSGFLTTYVNVQATGTFTGQPVLRLTLRSITNPGVESVEDRLLPSTSSEAWADLAIWGHCATPPCVEDLELVVELVGADEVTADLNGTIELSASGDNYDLERTTQVTITASPLP
jgi:hypothetical protein